MFAMTEIERTSPNSSRAVGSYDVSPDRLLAATRRAIERLPRWNGETYGADSLKAVRKTRFLRFKDDVTIRVSEDSEGSARAEFESASRIGRGDLGQNSRNLKELLGALEKELRDESG